MTKKTQKLRKVLTLAACAVLLVSVTIVGTVAYLTADDAVKNTFTVGDVEIKLDEADVDVYGEVDSEARVDNNEYKMLPNHTYVKDPTVTVLEGSEKSYVRAFVTISEKADLDAIFGENGLDLNNVFGGFDATAWTYKNCTVENDTRVYEFWYNSIVDAREAEKKLVPLFTTFTVPGDITNAQLESIDGMTIDVVAQAIQADGFANADAAWDAWN